MELDHLPGTLRKIDLIPVEEMYAAQERYEEKGSAKGDQQDSGRLGKAHL